MIRNLSAPTHTIQALEVEGALQQANETAKLAEEAMLENWLKGTESVEQVRRQQSQQGRQPPQGHGGEPNRECCLFCICQG